MVVAERAGHKAPAGEGIHLVEDNRLRRVAGLPCTAVLGSKTCCYSTFRTIRRVEEMERMRWGEARGNARSKKIVSE
jgi:hypothetical protein